MGNAVTRLSLVIDNNDSPHRAGTNLSGRIMIECRKAIQGTLIVLVVKGKEKSVVRRGKQTRTAHRDFFHVRLILRDLAQQPKVNPGTYSFPFSIELPDSLPTSFSWNKNCSIEYKCAVQMGAATSHIHFSVVSAPLPDVKVPCFLEPKTQEITSMGLLSKGSITFGVGVDDTHIGKGQELILSVACQNDTTVDIQHVYLKVVERLTWRVDNFNERYIKNVLLPMTELSLPGLVKRRKSKEQVQLDNKAGQDAFRQSNFQKIYEELSSGRNSIRIQIPQRANDTYGGTLITISHYIKLYLKTPTLVADIEEKIPLRIGTLPEIPQATQVDVRPADSAPSVRTFIPFAAAVPLPDNTVEAPVATARAEAIVLGGTVTTAASTDLADLIPMPPPQVPSLEVLLDEMTTSVNDIDIISSKLQSDDWRPVISALTPADYGIVVAHVNMEFDQPRVAAMLAPYVNGGDCFTCQYCLSAIQNASEWNRTAMVQKLLPLCVDVRIGFTMLQDELSPWEQTVTARDFQLVLDHSDR